MFRSVVVVIIALGLSGCAPSGKLKYYADLNRPTCEVTVFRDKFVFLLESFDLYVNTEAYVSLYDKHYVTFHLNQGEHTLRADWILLSTGVPLSVPVKCEPPNRMFIGFEGGNYSYNRGIKAFALTEAQAKLRMQTYKEIKIHKDRITPKQ